MTVDVNYCCCRMTHFLEFDVPNAGQKKLIRVISNILYFLPDQFWFIQLLTNRKFLAAIPEGAQVVNIDIIVLERFLILILSTSLVTIESEQVAVVMIHPA